MTFEPVSASRSIIELQRETPDDFAFTHVSAGKSARDHTADLRAWLE
jgi:hypothetical protein